MLIVESIRLALSPIVFTIAILVIYKYSRSLKSFNEDSASDWLILGILIGFIGKLIDNIFWNCAWSAYYFKHSTEWFEYGQLFNIPFRQIALIVSGFCHTKAAIMMGKQIRVPLIISVFLSVVICVLSAIAVYLTN